MKRLAVLAVAGVLVASCGTGDIEFTSAGTSLERVEDLCEGDPDDEGWAYVVSADDGRTLVVDSKGEEDYAGATYEQLVCVLNELDVPTSVRVRMGNTRALDGIQTATWDGFTASWSYHPDSGMDLIVEED